MESDMPRESYAPTYIRSHAPRVLDRVLIDQEWAQRPLLCKLGLHRPNRPRMPYGSGWRHDRQCTRCSYWWESKEFVVTWP